MKFEIMALIGTFVALILGALGLHTSGYRKGRAAAESAERDRLLELTKKRVAKNESINSLSDDDVDKRLRDKWKK